MLAVIVGIRKSIGKIIGRAFVRRQQRAYESNGESYAFFDCAVMNRRIIVYIFVVYNVLDNIISLKDRHENKTTMQKQRKY